MHTVWLSILCGCLVFNSFICATCINNEGWVLVIGLGSPAQKSSVCAHPPWAPLIPTAGPGTLALISGQEVQPVFFPKPCSCNILFVITFNTLLVSSDLSPADVQNLPMGGGACLCPSGCPAVFSSYMLHLPTEDTCFKCTAPFFPWFLNHKVMNISDPLVTHPVLGAGSLFLGGPLPAKHVPYFYLLCHCWWKIWLLPLLVACCQKRSTDLLGTCWFADVAPRLAQLSRRWKSFSEAVKLGEGWEPLETGDCSPAQTRDAHLISGTASFHLEPRHSFLFRLCSSCSLACHLIVLWQRG